MDTHVTGTLILRSIPDSQVRQKVEAFMKSVFKNASREKIIRLVSRTPVVISKNIPEKSGSTIAAKLEKLGASASFIPQQQDPEKPAEPPFELQEQIISRETAGDSPLLEDSAAGDGWLLKTKTSMLQKLGEVNKELWLVASLLALAGAMNYLVASQRMILGFYTLPTLFSAYFFGRRHATLTAFASVFLVGLLAYYNIDLFRPESPAQLIEGRWYDLTAWAGILVVTAYTMGSLYERHEKRLQELRQTYHGLLLILRQFVAKDKYTENHSYRVSIYAAKIATYLGLNSQTVEDIRDASLLHDIGKLDISRQLLYKAARLTAEEHRGMKKHVDKSAEILEPIGGPLRRILPIILAHHDKFDGSGYNPTSGAKIPLEARVIMVADVYDALTSDRPYRKAMSPFEAKDIIMKGAGTDFDPRVVDAFAKAFQRREMEVPDVVI